MPVINGTNTAQSALLRIYKKRMQCPHDFVHYPARATGMSQTSLMFCNSYLFTQPNPLPSRFFFGRQLFLGYNGHLI